MAARKKVEEKIEIIDEDYENPWYFKGDVFNSSSIGKAHGMIYLIEEISTGKIYIGQKVLWGTKTRMVNKKKKKIKVESDWKKYYSSSAYINKQVEEHGVGDFKRSVLMLVMGDGMLNYMELKIQMLLLVLEDETRYINGYVGGRISRSHYSKEKIVDFDIDNLNRICPNFPI